jgi:beta-D-xylosidase 4
LSDILSGKAAPAGRLGTTQYPADYVNQVPMTDMTLHPSSTNPGRTYKWFQGTPVFEFGHGLHFTKFALSWKSQPSTKYQIPKVSFHTEKTVDLNVFDTFTVAVRNTGKVTSDYVALLFISGSGGPVPLPNKQLASYTRLHSIAPGKEATAALKVTLGSVARADAQGNLWVYPGTYHITIDTGAEVSLTHNFELEGTPAQISSWPQEPSS